MESRNTNSRIRARTTTGKITARVFVSVGDKNRAVAEAEVLTEGFGGQHIKPYADPAYVPYVYANTTTAFS